MIFNLILLKTHVHLLSFLGLDDFEFDFETMFEEYFKYLYILYMFRYLKNTYLCASLEKKLFFVFLFLGGGGGDKITPINLGKK
jgi:hypothetical protein